MTNKEILLKAADDMEKRGYNDHSRRAEDGTVCVLGAFENVVPMFTDAHPILKLTADLLGLPPPLHAAHNPDAWRLATWSNGADKETVVNGLRKVAATLDS